MSEYSERWRSLEDLYQAALEREPSNRVSFLREACADESLRREVQALLDARAAGDELLERDVIRYAGQPLEAGTMLGQYRIEERIGAGGMGEVYRAFDTSLQRQVAFKVLPPEDQADPERKQRLLREARAASALTHPNIVTVHEVGSEGVVDFIAMELVDGKTLDAVIPPRGLPVAKALDYAIQIAGALAKAHSAGVVHRDFKPGNVMVTGPASGHPGLVKLVDFGLARRVEFGPQQETTLTLEGQIVGTPAYMSPEQAQGRPADARSDVFSFGVVLYEMLTGRRAFSGDSAAALVAAVLRDEPAPLAGKVPAELEKILLRCLRKEPDRRWQTMSDLRVALRELSEESQPAGVAAPPAKPRRSRLVSALLAVPLLAVAGWLLLRYSGHQSPTPSLRQLTSYPGSEGMPSLSPDGSQVAFVWNGEKADHSAIYVKMVDETNALRLTNDPAPEGWPAWSPDGKRIAFERFRPGAPGIWTISPMGGAEQKLADLRVTAGMSWSPNGKWLAVGQGSLVTGGDPGGILLVPADGGEPRRITNPKTPAGDRFPSFSPDGRLVAYASCPSIFSCDIFVQPLDSGYSPHENPRRITRQGAYCAGLAWSRDGGSLVYSGSLSWNMMPRLWRVSSSGNQPPEEYDLAGFQSMSPSIAAAGNRLAFARNAVDYDIWRYQAGGVPEPFLRSSLPDYDVQFSPDGSRIAFSSGRSGIVEIWTVDADGSHPVQLTKEIGRGQGSPSWSPDGRFIAFDSQNQNGKGQIYVVDANGGRPRSVIPGTSSDHVPSWSRDGKWIYFASDRSGRLEVWRVPMGGGQVQQITDNGGWRAVESTDGRTLFYEKYSGSPLFSRSLDGGPERRVLDYVTSRAFAPVEDGIYYIGRSGPDRLYPIQFYDFSTGASRLLAKLGAPVLGSLGVSPDHKTILFDNSATQGSDLMLIENFR